MHTKIINLRKGKDMIYILHGENSSLGLLKLFIDGNGRCHIIHAKQTNKQILFASRPPAHAKYNTTY